MIFKILDAYEIEIHSKNSFKNLFSRLSLIYKVLVGLIILATIAIIPIAYFFKDGIVPYVYLIVYMIVLFILTTISNKNVQKNYLVRTQNYNKKLSEIKELLERQEFNINSSKKLLSLIEKIKKYIEEEEGASNKKQEDNNEYFKTMILPIISFGLGQYFSGVKADEALILSVIGLFFASAYKFIKVQIIEISKNIFESTPIKMKYFLEELQDVYDKYYLEQE